MNPIDVRPKDSNEFETLRETRRRSKSRNEGRENQPPPSLPPRLLEMYETPHIPRTQHSHSTPYDYTRQPSPENTSRRAPIDQRSTPYMPADQGVSYADPPATTFGLAPVDLSGPAPPVDTTGNSRYPYGTPINPLPTQPMDNTERYPYGTPINLFLPQPDRSAPTQPNSTHRHPQATPTDRYDHRSEDHRHRSHSREPRHSRHRRDDVRSNLKIHEGMPKRFDNVHIKDPVAHLVSFGDYCDLHKLTDEREILIRFSLSLEGTPRRWLASINPRSWQECSSLFTKLYTGIMNYQSNLHKFRSLTWDESKDLETYRQSLSTLAAGIGNLYERDINGRETRNVSREFQMSICFRFTQ